VGGFLLIMSENRAPKNLGSTTATRRHGEMQKPVGWESEAHPDDCK
jgi:hypothetical protein